MPRHQTVVDDRHHILNASDRRTKDGRHAWHWFAVQGEYRGFAGPHLGVAPLQGEDAGADQRAGELSSEGETANDSGADCKMFITLCTTIYAESRDGHAHIHGEWSLHLNAN